MQRLAGACRSGACKPFWMSDTPSMACRPARSWSPHDIVSTSAAHACRHGTDSACPRHAWAHAEAECGRAAAAPGCLHQPEGAACIHRPAEPDGPACGAKCCKHKKKSAPKVPVIVRFRSQKGESRLVRLDPPTFAELERYVEEEFNLDNPELLHCDEAGRTYRLRSAEDLAHAVRVTGPDRYLTVCIARYEERDGAPCCCCGHPPPKAKLPKAKKTDPILEWNGAPPGLRGYLFKAPPFRNWTEIPEIKKGQDGNKKPQKPMLKAFIS